MRSEALSEEEIRGMATSEIDRRISAMRDEVFHRHEQAGRSLSEQRYDEARRWLDDESSGLRVLLRLLEARRQRRAETAA